jgi:hypothetical protein
MEQVDNETSSPPFSSPASSYDDDNDGEENDCDCDSDSGLNERIASRFAISAGTIVSSGIFIEMMSLFLPWLAIMIYVCTYTVPYKLGYLFRFIAIKRSRKACSFK